MNYWIFVHRGENIASDQTFPQLLEKKNWGFRSSQPIRNKIKSLKKNDIIVFYLGGQNCKYFAGEAKLVSNVYPPTRATIGGPDKQ